MDAPNELAKLVVSGGGYGTGIQYHQLGIGNFAGRVEPTTSEPSFERGTIGLRSAAPERLYEVTLQITILLAGSTHVVL